MGWNGMRFALEDVLQFEEVRGCSVLRAFSFSWRDLGR